MAKKYSKKASNIRGGISIDAESMAQFEGALLGLENAVREKVIENALQAAGQIIAKEANAKAPGPHVISIIVKGSELMRGWDGAGAYGIKPDASYAVVGPDQKHWYYRFYEYGTKAHGVKKRKRTVTQIKASKAHIKKSDLSTGVRNARPVMSWMVGGRQIFVKKVRGFRAKPFLRPAVDAKSSAAIGQFIISIQNEIKKAL